MRQVLQNVRTGQIALEEVPEPRRSEVSLLVANQCSVISPGTESTVMDLGRKSLAGKARARPDLARKVLDSVREEGLTTAYAKVRGRLSEPNPLGYSCAGIVLEAPSDSPAGPGELVACGGTGFASHAEVISVPRTLCARVPEGVPLEDAAYSTIAAVALHGIRICDVGLGDVSVVLGLGVVGQLGLEMLNAAGAVAMGFDPDPWRVSKAREAGLNATQDADELLAETLRLSSGSGADGVLVAAASADSAPLDSAVLLARDRATISVVGDVPISADRGDLFAKELRLVVSRSYGPGRYDPVHEEGGLDYPLSFVRWTEGRNIAAALRLMAEGLLKPSRLTTHRFALEDAPSAYDLLARKSQALGLLLRYPEHERSRTPRVVAAPQTSRRPLDRKRPRVAVIGAGVFARSVLIPALGKDVEISAVINASGASAQGAASRFGAPIAGTDPAVAFESPDIDAVIIATRHDTHAELVARALDCSKHVFVEKPLALDASELAVVEKALEGPGAGTLTVGFNRRFAPLATALRDALPEQAPVMTNYRVNAGKLPASHWLRDPAVGGGRIIGEFCHFVDFVMFVCGDAPHSVSAAAVEGASSSRDDNVTATLAFPNGSVATIAYSALGATSMSKERIEVFGEGVAVVLDDFRTLEVFRPSGSKLHRGKRDKGHAHEMCAFVDACRTGRSAQDPRELLDAMRATFAVQSSHRTGLKQPV